ncbi:ABC transporter permease [Bacilliculturomica massiliensis]|uniref:ABC transporter permease n=1 Tax=Bacilliculturomica massiliensis TaxID=1917867 RepID=UPI0010309031|nr:ABC transporter permease subunit [Bacilliculturomica massiliensis]
MKRSTTFINAGGPVRALMIGLFWLLIWQAVYMVMEKDYIVPSPFHTAEVLVSMLGTGEFYVDTAVTLGRVLSGMALSFAAGAVSAVLAYFVPFVRMLLGGVAAAFKAMPVMSVILFAILCMVSGLVPVFACFLMCYPVVHTNLLEGLDSIGEEYLELCRAYRIDFRKRLRQVYLPAISANIKAALSLISGLSWKAVVAAEVLASPAHSMGYQLLTAKVYLEADRLFAWTIAIIILSILFEKGVREALKWM